MSGGELSLRIRPAAAADLERLAWLERAAFADPWPAGMLGDELSHAAALMLVAARGAMAAAGYACFRLGAGESELLRVAVDPAARRQGIATALVAAGLERMRQAGAQHCHLEVRTDNAGAHAVYRRLGFTLGGRRPGYYRDGSDALFFTLSLAGGKPRGEPEPPGQGEGGAGGGARLDPA